MSEQEPQLERDQEFREALAALSSACSAATEAADVPEDSQASFERASELANVLREMSDRAAEVRALRAHRIWQQEAVSLAALGARIGVSKARAGQLIDIAKKIVNQPNEGAPRGDDSSS